MLVQGGNVEPLRIMDGPITVGDGNHLDAPSFHLQADHRSTLPKPCTTAVDSEGFKFFSFIASAMQ